jgi:hypothetical protein
VFDVLYALAFILHFYSFALAQLLTGLCIDLALLAATLCRQLGEHIAAGAGCVVELLLEPTPTDDWKREVECDPIRVPAVLLLAGGTCMVLAALVLLFWWEWEWMGTISPFQAVIATLLALPLGAAGIHLGEILSAKLAGSAGHD